MNKTKTLAKSTDTSIAPVTTEISSNKAQGKPDNVNHQFSTHSSSSLSESLSMDRHNAIHMIQRMQPPRDTRYAASKKARLFKQMQQSIGNSRLLRLISSNNRSELPSREVEKNKSFHDNFLYEQSIQKTAKSIDSSVIRAKNQPRVLGVQTKLTVGEPNDNYEREANTAATRVIANKPVQPLSKIPSGGLPRAIDVYDETDANQVDNASSMGLERQASQNTIQVDTELANRLNAPSGGRPMSMSVQRDMSEKFGTDFSNVRIHENSQAQADAATLGANAFTKGNHIWLGSQASENNQELMAHELAHVIQQRSVLGVPKDNIQASFISWAIKMGAKRASKNMLKNFIKTRIKSRIKNLTIKKFSKRFAKEADKLLDILEDPWWATAIGFIPIIGDAFDLARVPIQIKKAMNKADALESKIKKILSIQGKWAEKLIPASLKRSDSYFDELSQKSYAELVDMASSNHKAAKMKKLIEQQHRLMEKL